MIDMAICLVIRRTDEPLTFNAALEILRREGYPPKAIVSDAPTAFAQANDFQQKWIDTPKRRA